MRSGTLDDIPGLSDDIKRMYQILKRMESVQSIGSTISDFDISDDDLDSDDEFTSVNNEDLSKRLEGINLDDADAIWSKLTDSERQEFEKIVQSDDVSSILPPFNPWWESKVKKPMIEELNSKEQTKPVAQHPEISNAIVDFATISTKAPAPCVANNLVNVLAAYTLTVRFFVGDHLNSAEEAVNYMLSVCANLKTNANFDEPSLAIESVRYEAINEGFHIDDDDVQHMKKDIDNINEGDDPAKFSNVYVLAALSDLQRMLVAAKGSKKSKDQTKASTSCQAVQSTRKETTEEFARKFADHQILHFNNVDRSKLNTCLKKIEYYLAYVKKFR